jgi:hypothetical protein
MNEAVGMRKFVGFLDSHADWILPDPQWRQADHQHLDHQRQFRLR